MIVLILISDDDVIGWNAAQCRVRHSIALLVALWNAVSSVQYNLYYKGDESMYNMELHCNTITANSAI